MGDPKRLRKQYSMPKKPWQKQRIEDEKKLMSEYGLKAKKEIHKATSILRKFYRQAKLLVASRGKQAEVEKQQLLARLTRLGMLTEGHDLDAVLRLTIRDLLDRRLQTVLFKKGYVRTVKHSRQAIIHGHVRINEKKICVPSYLVPLSEENSIEVSGSILMDADETKKPMKKDKTAVMRKNKDSKQDTKKESEGKQKQEEEKAKASAEKKPEPDKNDEKNESDDSKEQKDEQSKSKIDSEEPEKSKEKNKPKSGN